MPTLKYLDPVTGTYKPLYGPPGPTGPTGASGGPTGPTGPTGPGGGGDSGVVAYRHYQTTAATTWTIIHSLDFQPNVTVVDSTGREVWPGEILYVNGTTVRLSFSAAFGGEAYLS